MLLFMCFNKVLQETTDLNAMQVPNAFIKKQNRSYAFTRDKN